MAGLSGSADAPLRCPSLGRVAPFPRNTWFSGGAPMVERSGRERFARRGRRYFCPRLGPIRFGTPPLRFGGLMDGQKLVFALYMRLVAAP